MERLPSEKPMFPRESIPGNRHTLLHNQYEVDVYKLIHLTKDIPETAISIDDFKSDLEDLSWEDNDGKKISPQSVIDAYRDADNFEKAMVARPELSRHLQKIRNADPSFPVIVFDSKIIDGTHRFVKAILEGQASLKAKIIETMPESAVIKIHEQHE